jgi:hypothetical protein
MVSGSERKVVREYCGPGTGDRILIDNYGWTWRNNQHGVIGGTGVITGILRRDTIEEKEC